MSRRFTRTTAALVTAAAVGAPGAALALTTSQRATPADDGKTATISKRGKLTISLRDNNPSTGFAWVYKDRPSRTVLQLVSDRTRAPEQGDPPIVGAPQPRTIVYRGIARGTTRIKLRYQRESGPAAGDDTLTLTVRVR